MQLVLLAVLTAALRAQTFDAASVKLNNSGGGGNSTNTSKGRIVITNQTLKQLIERAYIVHPFQVSGPDWLDSVRVDIVATYPPDTKRGDRAPMLRALLEERFHLSAHTISKDLPGYSLVPAKAGFKLKPVEPNGSSTSSNSNGRAKILKVTSTSMTELAGLLAQNLGQMVVDRTGFEGVYNFELRWAANDQPPDAKDPDPAPSLFTAIQESIGLRLKPEKVPTPIVVVDRIDRIPVEN